jgi:predicted RNase H-like nuclease (RuvC/YqgF family)
VQVIPQEQVDIQTSILAELQKRVVKAEVTVAQKEEENAALKDQLQQNEKRWLDYEAKMKAMEEMWQVQMASLQVSFLVNSIRVTKCMHHMLYCGMYNRSLKNSLRTVEKLIISYGFYIELSSCFTRYVD